MQNLSSFLKTLPYPGDQTILLVDIGARWGANTPWDQLDKKYVTYIGFEPDYEEYRSLVAKFGSANIEYIPVGLSDTVEEHILYVTREPGCSSIYQPNQPMLSKFFLSERWDVQKEVPIKTVPLAQVLDERKVVPDALKVDVQGAALKVLRGADQYIDQILLIEVEVEFCEMYKGEPLFGAVDTLIRQYGFDLIDMNKYYARRKDLGAKCVSRGQVMFADVLYVISIEKFYNLNLSQSERSRKLWNLVVMLSIYGHFDLALEFACHRQSSLSKPEKDLIETSIRKYTAIPRWKLMLFNNSACEKLGFLISLLGNSMQIKSRLFGWGSDQASVDSRYKHYFKHPVLKLFRK